MLFTEWDMDKALAISKEEGYEDGVEYGEKLGLKKGEKLGEQKERRKLILALNGVLSPEVIAEKFQVSLEYVQAVLNDGWMVSEESVPYKAGKKE